MQRSVGQRVERIYQIVVSTVGKRKVEQVLPLRLHALIEDRLRNLFDLFPGYGHERYSSSEIVSSDAIRSPGNKRPLLTFLGAEQGRRRSDGGVGVGLVVPDVGWPEHLEFFPDGVTLGEEAMELWLDVASHPAFADRVLLDLVLEEHEPSQE